MKIAIVDTGGNIFSLQKILSFSGYESDIIKSSKNLEKYKAYILPGIGSFDNPINKLKDMSLLNFFSRSENFKNKKLIGICSGMQILFEQSEEGKNRGLGLIPGKVKKFEKIKYKIPHMGWNIIKSQIAKFNLLDKKFYFAHSYFVECNNKFVIASCEYDIIFPAIINMDNIWGIQFHPEKSHLNGIELFQNILQ